MEMDVNRFMGACLFQFYTPHAPSDLKLQIRLPTDTIVQQWQRLAEGRTSVVVASSTEHAAQILAAFRSAGVRADLMHGGLQKRNPIRMRIVQNFRARATSVLCVAHVFGELADCDVECVVLAHRTMSRLQYLAALQFVVHREGDPCGMVLDVFGCACKYGLPDDLVRTETR